MEQREELLEQYGSYFCIPGAAEDETQQIADTLLRAYEEPARSHHDLNHFAFMATFINQNRSELERPREMMWSVAGHDVVNDPGLMVAGENETWSSVFTTHLLKPYLSNTTLRRIDRKIMATANHQPDGSDPDQPYLLDADLGVLGSSPEEFDQYDAGIREEYNFVAKETFNQKRLEILRIFAERAVQGALYLTDAGQAQFGSQAAENLTRKVEEYEHLTR